MSNPDHGTHDILPLQAPPLQSKKSSHSLLNPGSHLSGRLSPTFAADATTAVTLENVDQAELANGTEAERDQQLHPVALSRFSMVSNDTADPGPSSGDEDDIGEAEEGNLTNMLQGLMVKDINRVREQGVASLTNFNIFSDDTTAFDEAFVKDKIILDKEDGADIFHGKLKQFFIFSMAGKPIYSMNGSEDKILGYMGLLTTIISTFQESMKTEFHHISQDGFRMVVLNKNPILLVAMSKIPQELVPSTGADDSLNIIENQLKILYNYLLAVLSKPVITKNFEKGMNFDLRRILTAQDTHMLDSLSMSLTYGFSVTDDDKYQLQGAYYVSSILNNALQCAKITNTSRSKLNSILLLCKKLKYKDDSSDTKSTMLALKNGEIPKAIAGDLLFGLLILDDKIINYMKPRNHALTNEDLHTLLSTLSASYKAVDQEISAELWIPLCMPNFNSSGFLYLFVKKFKLEGCAKPITIALLSSNKNSFYEMKEVAEYIIQKIVKKEAFAKTLAIELSLSGNLDEILKQLNITDIKHFIVKRKSYNQVYMDEVLLSSDNCDVSLLKAHCHMLYFYSSLVTSKATIVKQKGSNPKKLTYTRWQLNDEWITAFMLADEKYEFYCVCGGQVQAQEIIDQSLRLIKWCERYKKRLFVGSGVTF